MAGLYFHIPFCKSTCTYCDFYHTIDMRRAKELINCMHKELDDRVEYLGNEIVESIYFGGGTPSLMQPETIAFIIDKVRKEFSLHWDPEITLEANPDDIQREYLAALREAGINRISLGVQSFHDFMLNFMGRRHNARKALDAIRLIQEEGINNISIDIIYGSPGYTSSHLIKDLEVIEQLKIPHFSAYLLTPSEGTVLSQKITEGEVIMPDEAELFAQYMVLCDFSRRKGYRHYEISNFCREGYIARHNKGYWGGMTYCGIGPSAHSYDGFSRRWNVSSLYGYILSVKNGALYYEEEMLTEKDRYNEYLLTALRTDEGVSVNAIRREFGEHYAEIFLQDIAKYSRGKYINQKGDFYILTEEGMFMSDGIISSLFQ